MDVLQRTSEKIQHANKCEKTEVMRIPGKKDRKLRMSGQW